DSAHRRLCRHRQSNQDRAALGSAYAESPDARWDVVHAHRGDPSSCRAGQIGDRRLQTAQSIRQSLARCVPWVVVAIESCGVAWFPFVWLLVSAGSHATLTRNPSGTYFFASARCLAQRFFCASEIAFRAAADNLRRLRTTPLTRPRTGIAGD